MKLFYPQKIYVEAEAKNYPKTQEILGRLQGVPVEEISDTRALIETLKNKPDPVGEGKRYLLLARDQGRSFKPFPEAEDYLSCDYFTLHVAEGCDLECSYCILQTYLTNPLLTVYVNVEEMLENLDKILTSKRDKFFRIGTGQLADSLSLDHITHFSKDLVPFFHNHENAILELKTKSNNVENLLELDAKNKTIVAWSMNTHRIQQQEEHKCASLSERIEAAKKIIDSNFKIAFHLDPIIDYPGWEKEYAEILEELLREIPHEKIAWISLGCLRFMPKLKSIMQQRFPKSQLPLAEWIRGMDGKMRYFKPRRIEIYKTMVSIIRQHASKVTLYLSMESTEVWQQVFGGEHTRASVCEMLDTAVKP